jgi:hypothetical protein
MPAGDRGDANGRIEQCAQRAFATKRQNGDAKALGHKGVTEQDYVALRAATFEGAHHYGQIRSVIFRPR